MFKITISIGSESNPFELQISSGFYWFNYISNWMKPPDSHWYKFTRYLSGHQGHFGKILFGIIFVFFLFHCLFITASTVVMFSSTEKKRKKWVHVHIISRDSLMTCNFVWNYQTWRLWLFPFFYSRTSHMNQWNESTFWVFNAKGNSFYIFLTFNCILVKRY